MRDDQNSIGNALSPDGSLTQDHRVREISELQLELRSGLRFTPHFEAGVKCYLVEDVARSQFFRIGIAEYLLISMFDGKTTVGEAIIRLSQLNGDHQITEADATAICKWLVDSEMAHTSASSDGQRLASNSVDRTTKKRLGAWNPLCMKVPLAYPDRLIAKITPWFGRCFGITAALLGLIVSVIAIYQIASVWDDFASASSGIFAPSRWFWLAACWLALKFVHESAHGIVCRKYGGAVHEAGVIMVLFAPLAYVDLTSSWRFRSKWKRIHTAAAGMYVELWIAAIAAITWVATDPGQLNDVCFNLVIMASLSTIVFNANPLMRFDGYYILSDLLEIPNLYSEGQQYLQYLGRRYVLGENIVSSLNGSPRDVFTRLYGVAAFVWRIFICVSLVIAASMLFHGLGVVLAVIAVVLWVGVPIVRLLKHVGKSDGLSRYRRRRLTMTIVAAGVAGFLILTHAPWPGVKRAAAVVQYEPLAFVRAASPGFVDVIHVQSGQHVDAGEVIAELRNQQLVSELQDLKLAIKQSVFRSRVFKQTDEMHSYQGEMEQQRSLRNKLVEKQEQVDQLTLRAPIAGRVVARQLSIQIGTYVQPGAELATIGDESRKELQIAIAQADFEPFAQRLGKPINVRLSGGMVLTSQLQSVEPRATNHAPQESMYAALGGPLESRAADSQQSGQSFELLAPHFTGVVKLSPSTSRNLRVGQSGVVWFGRHQETVGSVVQRKLRKILPSSLMGIVTWAKSYFAPRNHASHSTAIL